MLDVTAEVWVSDGRGHDEVDGPLKEMLQCFFETEKGGGVFARGERSELRQKIEIAEAGIESAAQG